MGVAVQEREWLGVGLQMSLWRARWRGIRLSKKQKRERQGEHLDWREQRTKWRASCHYQTTSSSYRWRSCDSYRRGMKPCEQWPREVPSSNVMVLYTGIWYHAGNRGDGHDTACLKNSALEMVLSSVWNVYFKLLQVNSEDYTLCAVAMHYHFNAGVVVDIVWWCLQWLSTCAVLRWNQ